jgi:hypothetical protein
VQLSPTSINFPGGSAIAANNSGNCSPLPAVRPARRPPITGGKVVQLFVITSLAAVRDARLRRLHDIAAGAIRREQRDVFFPRRFPRHRWIDRLQLARRRLRYGSGQRRSRDQRALPPTDDYNIVAATGGSANATLVMPIQFTLTTDIMGLGQGVFNFNGTMTARATVRARRGRRELRRHGEPSPIIITRSPPTSRRTRRTRAGSPATSTSTTRSTCSISTSSAQNFGTSAAPGVGPPNRAARCSSSAACGFSRHVAAAKN